jgi:hypothetical protein
MPHVPDCVRPQKLVVLEVTLHIVLPEPRAFTAADINSYYDARWDGDWPGMLDVAEALDRVPGMDDLPDLSAALHVERVRYLRDAGEAVEEVVRRGTQHTCHRHD